MNFITKEFAGDLIKGTKNILHKKDIESVETPWKYSFFVDVTFDTYKEYQKAIAILEIMAEDFKVLGEYKNGRI